MNKMREKPIVKPLLTNAHTALSKRKLKKVWYLCPTKAFLKKKLTNRYCYLSTKYLIYTVSNFENTCEVEWFTLTDFSFSF